MNISLRLLLMFFVFLESSLFCQAPAFCAEAEKETVQIAQNMTPWMEKLIRVGVLVFFGAVLFYLLKKSIRKFENIFSGKETIRESQFALRAKTISRLFFWIGSVSIVLVIGYMVLQLFGFDVAPLLAGAGIIGLAFGFGGQYLIRDIISGLFILFEGQYSIDDIVKIGEVTGVVENINLRTTVLRDMEGKVMIIPNGEIKSVINFTKDYSYAVLKVGVSYKEDADKVMQVIKDLGADLRKDPFYSRLILENLEMLGVEDFTETQMKILFRVKTFPTKQWDVAREFRRRLKKRFDELGIRMQ